jgi:hypothetical protein
VSVNKLQTWTLATRQKSQTQTGPVWWIFTCTIQMFLFHEDCVSYQNNLFSRNMIENVIAILPVYICTYFHN